MVVMLGASSCAAPPLAPAPLPSPSSAIVTGPAVAAWSPPWGPHTQESGVTPGAPSIAPAEGSDSLEPVNVAYISPSALESFAPELGGCERKWAWSKLDRIPKVMGDAAALGDGVHKQHEAWLGQGIPYDLTKRVGQLAMATMHLLPAPGVARVEQEVIYDWRASTGRVIRLGGKIDANWFDDEHMRPIVLDHKTTGSIGFRKDTKEKLLGHPQAPIYATWALESAFQGVRDVELRWNYVDTKPKRPMAYPSWHVVRHEEAAAAMLAVVEPAAIRLLDRVEQANSERRAGRPFAARHLPMNTNACSAFGGCQFRSRCSLTPSQEFNAHMVQASNSFLARLNINPGGASPAPAAAAPVVQTSPIPAVAQASAQPAVPSEGYGAAINPPESTQAPAPAPAASAPAPAVEVLPAAPVAGPGRGKKKPPATPDAQPTHVASEAPATPTNPSGSLFIAAIQGACANPSIVCFGPEKVVDFARAVVKAAGGES